MSGARGGNPQFILNAVAATGAGNTINVKDFRNLKIELSSANSGDFTMKVQGALGTGVLGGTAPNFDAAKTVANPFDNIAIVDNQDDANITGDTGVSFAGTDDVRILVINTDGLDFITCNITAYVAGNITCRFVGYSNY